MRPSDDVAEVLDRERAPVRAGRARVVDEADVVVERQLARSARANSCGVISPSRWKLRSLSVHCQANALRRRAEVDAEDAVDRRRGSRACLRRSSSVGAGEAARSVQRAPRAACREDRVHAPGLRRALGLRHDRLRHEAVLARRGRRTCSTGRRRRPDAGEQVGDGAVVDVAVGGLDDRLEEVVGPLDLVPEHRVVLARTRSPSGSSRCIAPTRSRLRPANIQQRPVCFWLVTAQSSSRFDTDVSVETTDRSRATSSTTFVTRRSAPRGSPGWTRTAC